MGVAARLGWVRGGAAEVDGVPSDQLTYCWEGVGIGAFKKVLTSSPSYSSFDSHSSPRLTDTMAASMDVRKGNGSVGEKKKLGKMWMRAVQTEASMFPHRGSTTRRQQRCAK